MFGHFGIEWDLTTATGSELQRLAEWVSVHKELRGLLHTGTVVHADHPDPALWVHGVVSADQGRAIYGLAQVATSVGSPPGPVRLPGLAPDTRYRLAPLPPAHRIEGPGLTPLPWWSEGVTMSGRVVAEVGLQAPMQYPERMVMVEAVRIAG